MITLRLSPLCSVTGALAIVVSSVLASCAMPNDGQVINPTHYAAEVVETDGSGHWVIAEDVGGAPIPTDDGVFVVKEGGALFRVSYDGSVTMQLYPTIQWNYTSLLPNGKKILLGTATASASGLYLMDADGSNLVKLGVPNGLYVNPGISPNLDEIVFYRDHSIGRMKIDGTNFQYIWKDTGSTYAWFATYVDETHIVYEVSDRGTNKNSIRVFNTASQDDKLMGELLSGSFPLSGKTVDGSHFLMSGIDGIRIFDVDNLTVRTVGQGRDPSYSPDGSQIVFIQGSNVVTTNADGSHVKTIAVLDSIKSLKYPQFSPDGKHVVLWSVWKVMY
ncbi:MAG: hypothetical protein NTU47_14150 [Ignavibacteriales bacterium]|nr:hypothetical protein [Ignavibacteriales bacterium]